MKTIIKTLSIALLGAVLVGCSASRAEQMAIVDNIKVECTPEILATVGGQVPASIAVTYPEGYFQPKAILNVTPVLVYEGGEVAGPTYTYQGEKIKDNNKVVSKKGGSVKESFSFAYADGMQKSHLELRSTAYYGDKKIAVPAIKVADGVNTTALLVNAKGVCELLSDGYQQVIHTAKEGQILYDVNSSNVKNSQLKSSSVKDLQKALKEVKENDRTHVTGTKIIAYASPEGGQDYNAKLSDKRAGTAEKAWDKISKGMDASSTEIQSIGQDWDGFKKAVSESNVEDKDLILRVLSMYNDPAVREREIRNMSKIYTEINKNVFPALRRARFITEIEYQNYSDEELLALAAGRLNELQEDGLLRVATLTEDAAQKEYLYTLASEKFESAIATYNLAVMALGRGDTEAAQAYAAKLGNGSEANDINGIVAMRAGKLDAAIRCFNASKSETAKENLAIIDVIKGDYKAAVKDFASIKGENAAVAYLAAGQTDKAAAAIEGDSATADYIRAIIAARNGNSADVAKYLKLAGQKDPALLARSAKDIEFVAYK